MGLSSTFSPCTFGAGKPRNENNLDEFIQFHNETEFFCNWLRAGLKLNGEILNFHYLITLEQLYSFVTSIYQ